MLAALLPVATAGAAVNSVVRGSVSTAQPGQRLTDIGVQLISLTDESYVYYDCVAKDGTFGVAGPAGDYILAFTTDYTNYVFWTSNGPTMDRGQAERIPLREGSTITGVNLICSKSGVSGSVVSQLPTNDFGYGTVYAFQAGESDPDLATNSQFVQMSQGGLAYGAFSMSLAQGPYTFMLQDFAGNETWLGGTSAADARQVNVSNNSITPNIDVKTGTSATAPTQGAPTISGTPDIGATLSVNPGSWPANTTFTYGWPGGSTDSTYVVSASDYNSVVPLIYADVTATVPGWEPIYVYSPFAGLPSNARAQSISNRVTAAPSIGGPSQVGQVLSTNGGAWSGAATRSYQWLRNGGAIPGATGAAYQLTPADAGTAVSVLVTAAESPYVNRSAPTAPVAAGNLSTGNPSIVGKRKVRKTVFVAGLESSPGAGVSIQWLRKGKPIAGATGTSYKIAKADKGKKKGLSVQVTWSTPGYVPVTKVSPVVKVK